MRVLSLKTLREFWELHPDAEPSLRAWYSFAEKATCKTPADVKKMYSTASVFANNRVVFNIKGNQYRLVVAVQYKFGQVYVRFIGTHQEYDKIDAATI